MTYEHDDHRREFGRIVKQLRHIRRKLNDMCALYGNYDFETALDVLEQASSELSELYHEVNWWRLPEQEETAR